jgi:hypothetical protein
MPHSFARAQHIGVATVLEAFRARAVPLLSGHSRHHRRCVAMTPRVTPELAADAADASDYSSWSNAQLIQRVTELETRLKEQNLRYLH